eukprot:2004422-Pyramimonas_sp.AAC.1
MASAATSSGIQTQNSRGKISEHSLGLIVLSRRPPHPPRARSARAPFQLLATLGHFYGGRPAP